MKERHIWLENTRAIATIAVIILHVAAPILYQYGKTSDGIWHTANIYDSIVRFCVPVFFMISGSLLLSKDYKLRDFFKKRFFKIIPPFVFWALIYVLYDTFVTKGELLSLYELGEKVIVSITKGGMFMFHLWFVYALLGLYLFIPILRKWIKYSTMNEIRYFLIIWLVTIFLSISNFRHYFPSISLVNFTGYIGYLVLGYYLTRITVKNKYIPYIFLLVGIIATIFGTYYLTQENNKFSGYFYEYLSPNVLITSIGVFLIFKNLKFKNRIFKRILRFISEHSFGIYLVHILVLSLLNKFGITYHFTHPIISVPILTILCLTLSSLLIYLLRKLKFGKYISG